MKRLDRDVYAVEASQEKIDAGKRSPGRPKKPEPEPKQTYPPQDVRTIYSRRFAQWCEQADIRHGVHDEPYAVIWHGPIVGFSIVPARSVTPTMQLYVSRTKPLHGEHHTTRRNLP